MSLLKTHKNENFTPTTFSDILTPAWLFSKNLFEKEFGQAFPAVNVRESAGKYQLELAVPGFRKEDFHVRVEGNVMTIQAEKKEEKKEEQGQFTRHEFSYNSFSRSFTLPEEANEHAIEAGYTDGILKLTIAKKEGERALPHKEIQVA